MAGYVKLFRSIWNDPDFRALDSGAQRLYMLLISQADMTAAGVVGRMERRWARLATDTTVEEVSAALDRLRAADFVAVDDDTDEVLVRSYIRYDEMWKVPNGLKSVESSVGSVLSDDLRSRAAASLAEVIGDAGIKGSAKGSDNPSVKGKATPAASSHNHNQHQQPAASSPTVDATRRADSEPTSGPLHAAAEDALDIWLTHRLTADSRISNPVAWLKRTRAMAREEYREALEACPASDDPRSIAQRVFKLSTNQAYVADAERRKQASA